MKALMLEAYDQLGYVDMPDPEPAPGEVVVAVRATGICGSDVHGMDGSTGRRQPPIVMGHESAGVIARLGEGVEGWGVGDHVTFDSTVYCGACLFCRRGEINLCDDRRVLGVSCDEYRRHGAFADYVAVPQRILYRLPEGISFAKAALVEPVSIAAHAVNRTPMKLGDSAVVFGAGMIGLLVVQVLRQAGYGTIIAVDIDAHKVDLARKLGADIGIDAAQTGFESQILNATNGVGVDHAFEAVGIESILASAFKTVRKGGTITLIGNLAPSVNFPLQAAVTREITLLGSCASSGEYPACLDMIARGAIDLDPLLSVVAPLSEGAEWFSRLYNKDPGLMKVVLEPKNGSAND